VTRPLFTKSEAFTNQGYGYGTSGVVLGLVAGPLTQINLACSKKTKRVVVVGCPPPFFDVTTAVWKTRICEFAPRLRVGLLGFGTFTSV
jgi:hypothetical protein